MPVENSGKASSDDGSSDSSSDSSSSSSNDKKKNQVGNSNAEDSEVKRDLQNAEKSGQGKRTSEEDEGKSGKDETKVYAVAGTSGGVETDVAKTPAPAQHALVSQNDGAMESPHRERTRSRSPKLVSYGSVSSKHCRGLGGSNSESMASSLIILGTFLESMSKSIGNVPPDINTIAEKVEQLEKDCQKQQLLIEKYESDKEF